MNRLLVLAFGAPMVLIGAAYPDKIKSGGAHPAPDSLEQEVATMYRACRPGPGDDRCIQLYERGVRAAYARWQRGRGDAPATRVAMGGPMEEEVSRPRRRHHGAVRPDRYASRDDRCAHPRHHEAPRHHEPARHRAPRHEPPYDPEGEPEALGM